MKGNWNSYVSGQGFKEVNPVPDIALSDSTEVWLIQWPTNQFKLADLYGKELTLKLHENGQLASFESSGKCYDVVSFASKEPNAVLLPLGSQSQEVVQKISRKCALVRYPKPEELAKRSTIDFSSIRSGASSRKTMITGLTSMRRSSQGSAMSRGALAFSPPSGKETAPSSRKDKKNKQVNSDTPSEHQSSVGSAASREKLAIPPSPATDETPSTRKDKKRKRADDGSKLSNASEKSSERPTSTGSAASSHISSSIPSKSEQSRSEKPKKKKTKIED